MTCLDDAVRPFGLGFWLEIFFLTKCFSFIIEFVL